MIPAIQKVSDFMTQHCPSCRQWNATRLREWVTWHFQIGGVGLVNESGRIVGVLLARRVNDPRGLKEGEWQHDPEGKTVYVDLAVTSKPRAFARGWRLLLARFGDCRQIAFRRSKYGGRVRVYNFQHFLLNLQRGVLHG